MLDDAILDYLQTNSLREPAVTAGNRRQTEADGRANLQIDPEQGQLIALLIRLIGARNALEVGVFAGYSALWIAEAIGAEGRLLALDNDAEITQRARASWQAAGVDERIDLVIDQAAETLEREIFAGRSGYYDVALIDADKTGYIDYYEYCLQLVRPGGLILADNTLWYGRVADSTVVDDDTESIRAFNRYLHADARIDLSLLPVGDGLSVARRRQE